jgi:hypothetical protein
MIPRPGRHQKGPLALQRVDKLLAHLDIDQHGGTPDDMLKTATLDLMDDSAREGQMMAGKAIAAILGGDMLVVEADGGVSLRDAVHRQAPRVASAGGKTTTSTPLSR